MIISQMRKLRVRSIKVTCCGNSQVQIMSSLGAADVVDTTWYRGPFGVLQTSLKQFLPPEMFFLTITLKAKVRIHVLSLGFPRPAPSLLCAPVTHGRAILHFYHVCVIGIGTLVSSLLPGWSIHVHRTSLFNFTLFLDLAHCKQTKKYLLECLYVGKASG